ncbi:MerR family transcriptional regulator [Nonomuraea sp. NPDC000554]|uniref:MerR family transcriptional regulator n=1 Tax=Nonomuraea sp. NPDC000554 TaxID=3154259 RepID=UPI003319E41B
MHSHQLAKLAGVTVRTLRHYHQIGILSEPPRSPNGYRRYTVDDLVRLLRIRHLVGLGVSLTEVPSILDDDLHESTTMVLDRIEADIDAKMAQLSAQRDLVRSLRTEGGAPDAPAGLGGDLSKLHSELGLPAEAARFDLDVATLIAQLSGPDVHAAREAIANLSEHATPAFFDAVKQLAQMPPDAPGEQRQRTADALRANLPTASPNTCESADTATTKMLQELQQLHLNSAQLDTLARLRAPRS